MPAGRRRSQERWKTPAAERRDGRRLRVSVHELPDHGLESIDELESFIRRLLGKVAPAHSDSESGVDFVRAPVRRKMIYKEAGKPGIGSFFFSWLPGFLIHTLLFVFELGGLRLSRQSDFPQMPDEPFFLKLTADRYLTIGV